MPETVVVIVPAMDIGGAQETALSVARHLPAAGWTVVAATFADGPMRGEFEAAGVPVEILADRRHRAVALPWFLADMVRIRRALIEVTRRHGAEVVQIQTLGTLAFVVMTLRIGGHAKVFWRVANVSFSGPVRPGVVAAAMRAVHRALYRVGARVTDGVIAVSDEVAEAFVRETGARRDRVHVVLNGVDTDRFPATADRDAVRRGLGFGPEARLVTCVANFKEQKGHRFLVEAAARVLPASEHVHLLLVGDGDLRPAIEAQIAAVGLGDRVHLLGDRRDVAQILLASDAFVLPSLWEGFSVALVEAMASALPVIATAVSGTTQVMRDGETGWLVPPGDADALAGAMTQMLTDPAGAPARGRAARERVVSAFSASAQADRYAALYRGEPAVAATEEVVRP
ncbi:MAG: glycosyltransferase [Actinomycetota bacterium]